MSKNLYTENDLKEAIEKYLKEEKQPTPRHFRISLGISKQTLNVWKSSQPKMFDLMKTAEDLILAAMEQKFAYGGKEFYNIAFILRAYDRELYNENWQQQTLEKQEQVQILIDIPQETKGVKHGTNKSK